MTHPVRFHVLLLPNVPWVELRQRAITCESLGFDLIGLADHFVDWTNPPADWFESWTTLAALADATSSIRLTTLVSQIPLRPPAMFARQALTLDHISNGRLEIGLGTGLTIDPSYAMVGLPNWSAGERVARFAEYVELVRALLSNEITTYAGRFYQVDGAYMNPRPFQHPHPPLTIAALGPRMMRLAAIHADTWNTLSFQPDPASQLAEIRTRLAEMDAICIQVDRDPATLRRSYTMFDAQARHRGGAVGYLDGEQQLQDQVGPLLDLGITDIGLYYPIDPAQTETFARIATDVLPSLRD